MWQKKYFDLFWLLCRIWFGSLLLYNSLYPAHSNALYILSQWLGNTLDDDTRDLVPRIAREIEFICGLLVLLGLFTRKVNALLATFMLAAVISSKIGWIEFDNANKALTNIFFWFSCLFIFFGPGKWSLDQFFFRKRSAQPLK
ncbi:MAG TPA: DoxX family protein [Puia sp.]|nr:DoxX family protein [Puia sp.]